MNRGPVISGVVTLVAVVGVVVAFASGSSPYVTMAQARAMKDDDQLHLAGDLIKESVAQDISQHVLRFKVRDQDGTIVDVVYKGETPVNMSEATKVVAIGRADGSTFLSKKLLLKCPSKYEAEPKKSVSDYRTS